MQLFYYILCCIIFIISFTLLFAIIGLLLKIAIIRDIKKYEKSKNEVKEK